MAAGLGWFLSLDCSRPKSQDVPTARLVCWRESSLCFLGENYLDESQKSRSQVLKGPWPRDPEHTSGLGPGSHLCSCRGKGQILSVCLIVQFHFDFPSKCH